MIELIRTRRLEHFPNLNTVLMVEETLKRMHESVITIPELKRRLPKKVMHQTLLQILEYLDISGKIVIGTKGILWIYTDNKKLRELIGKGTEL